MKKTETQILYDSPEAARYVTGIEGWVDANGRFWGKDEHAARYSGCTHFKCDCGNSMEKGWLKCEECRWKSKVEKYKEMPTKEWDGKEYLYSLSADKYFFSEDDLTDYCYEEETKPEDLMLVFCEPNYLSELELYSDMFPDDIETDDVVDRELLTMLEELNKKIREHKPISYTSGKVRVMFNNVLNGAVSDTTKAK
jgi:hypothetical protein